MRDDQPFDAQHLKHTTIIAQDQQLTQAFQFYLQTPTPLSVEI